MDDDKQCVFLSDEEVGGVLVALARGQETFTPEEGAEAVKWATEVRLQEALLEMVLLGELALLVTAPGELRFRLAEMAAEAHA